MLDYDTSDADYFKYVYWSGFDGTCMSEESYSRTYLFDTLGNWIVSPDSVVKISNSVIFLITKLLFSKYSSVNNREY